MYDHIMIHNHNSKLKKTIIILNLGVFKTVSPRLVCCLVFAQNRPVFSKALG